MSDSPKRPLRASLSLVGVKPRLSFAVPLGRVGWLMQVLYLALGVFFLYCAAAGFWSYFRL